MFADLNLQRQRVVSVGVISTDDKGYVTHVPRSMSGLNESLRVMPTLERVKSLARKLLAEQWVLANNNGSSRLYIRQDQPQNVEANPLAIKGIAVAVWQYDFDAEQPQLVRKKLFEERIMANEE